MDIQRLLASSPLFFDGGTGTMLQARGLKPNERTELWSIEKPEELIALHKAYIEAGSDIINTNTFGVSKFLYGEGKDPSLERLVGAAAENVREAIRQAGVSRRIYISVDIGPTGQFLEPLGDLPFEEAYDNYRRLAVAGEAEGADCATIETMFTLEEARAALKACRENTGLPVFLSFSFSENGRLLSGETIAQAAEMAEENGAAAVGFNCGFGPGQMKPLAEEMLKSTSLPVIVTPNAGLPKVIGGKTCYTMDAESFARQMAEIAALGIRLMGGCCGTTPEFIRAVTEKLR